MCEPVDANPFPLPTVVTGMRPRKEETIDPRYLPKRNERNEQERDGERACVLVCTHVRVACSIAVVRRITVFIRVYRRACVYTYTAVEETSLYER